MTAPQPATLEREKDKHFLTEAELYRRLGVDRKVAKATIGQLMAKGGFPQPQKLWGNRWYWPAVKAWLDRHYGLGNPTRPLGGAYDR